MITIHVPADWGSLQEESATLLRECGYEAETEKTVETSHGSVELDVYASEVIDGRTYSLICECKHWKRKIPQSTIHSFRTVVGDIGANKGYIISLNGFQSGSVKSAKFTNVELVTWIDFQNLFVDTWVKNYLIPIITKELDPLLSYTDPVDFWLKAKVDKLSDNDKENFYHLRNKYMPFGLLCWLFTPYHYMTIKNLSVKDIPQLPLIKNEDLNIEGFENIPVDILEAEGYREFLILSLAYGKELITDIRELLKKSE